MDLIMNYFDDVRKQDILYKELQEWIGTPYKHRCMVKGKGVDCIHLVAGVFININAINSKLKYPEYDPDWHLHNSRELLYEYIHKNINVKDIYKTDTLNNGDILLYKFGKASAHAGLYFDGYVYHSVLGLKVFKSVLKDSLWYSRLTYILRLQK